MTSDWLRFTSGPIDPEERYELLASVWDAQRNSAMRNRENASNTAAINGGVASMSMVCGLASAILATGGIHAPVTQARVLLFERPVPDELPAGRIPGFGNSFFKDRIDPSWEPVSEFLRSKYPKVWDTLDAWLALFDRAGKTLFPNAAAFTAAVADLVNWPSGQEIILVVQPRLMVWSALIASEIESVNLRT